MTANELITLLPKGPGDRSGEHAWRHTPPAFLHVRPGQRKSTQSWPPSGTAPARTSTRHGAQQGGAGTLTRHHAPCFSGLNEGHSRGYRVDHRLHCQMTRWPDPERTHVAYMNVAGVPTWPQHRGADLPAERESRWGPLASRRGITNKCADTRTLRPHLGPLSQPPEGGARNQF